MPETQTPDIHITYPATIQQPHAGLYGKLLQNIAAHPILAGALAGLLVVAFAALRSSQGVLNEPAIAATLGTLVIVVWTVLFFLMRPFFQRQSFKTVEVTREIILTDDLFTRKESNHTLQTIPQPTLQLFTQPVPPTQLADRMGRDTPTPVWIVIQGPNDHEKFVLKTRITASEASQYPTADTALTQTKPHEELPINFASPLLMVIRKRTP